MRFRFGFAVLFSCFFALSSSALAADRCTASYENAQELRLDGDLVGAREALLECSQPACADFMQEDCARWLFEVEVALPSVTFTARDDSGQYLTNVRVTVDGKVLVTKLEGRSVPVNPGRHEVLFEADGFPAQRIELFVNEGQKSQIVEAKLNRPEPIPAAAPVPPAEQQSSRVPAYVLGSLGVVGLAGFGMFALSGSNAEDDLRQSACARSKTCTDEDTEPVERKYLLADVSLGIGVVALGAAAYLFVSGDSAESRTSASKPQLSLRVGPAGAFAGVRASY